MLNAPNSARVRKWRHKELAAAHEIIRDSGMLCHLLTPSKPFHSSRTSRSPDIYGTVQKCYEPHRTPWKLFLGAQQNIRFVTTTDFVTEGKGEGVEGWREHLWFTKFSTVFGQEEANSSTSMSPMLVFSTCITTHSREAIRAHVWEWGIENEVWQTCNKLKE